MFCFYIHCIVLFYAIWPYGHKNEIKVLLFTVLLLTKYCQQMNFQVLRMHQICWRPGLCPGSHWGSSQRKGQYSLYCAERAVKLRPTNLLAHPQSLQQIDASGFYAVGSESCRFCDRTRNNGRWNVQGHARSPILILIGMRVISYRFRVILTSLCILLYDFHNK